MTVFSDIELKAADMLARGDNPDGSPAAETKTASEEPSAETASESTTDPDDLELIEALSKEEEESSKGDDEWSALKQAGITPAQVQELLRKKPEPEVHDGLTPADWKRYKQLRQVNPEAAQNYLDAIAGGIPSIDAPSLSDDPLEALKQQQEALRRQFEALAYQVVQGEARKYVERELPQFQDLKKAKADIEDRIISRLERVEGGVTRDNITSLVRQFLKEEQQTEAEVRAKYRKELLEELKAKKKLHAPATSHPGAPLKSGAASKPIRRSGDWDPVTAAAERLLSQNRKGG